MPSIVFDAKTALSDKYVDLAPVDDADQSGIYAEALDFAIKNGNIFNVALTGPYGSGKSSIIKTYEKNSDIKMLRISLACFQLNATPDEKLEIDDSLIEKSILQQILYSAPSSAVPYSRVKRIKEPQDIMVRTVVLAVWTFFLFLFSMFDEVVITTSDRSFLWAIINSVTISYLISVPILFVMDLYRFLFSESFKKISIRNGEIELGDDKKESFLNKNLDEILYFFSKMPYELVVFEDLDRFGSPSIFIKLREINTLINSSQKNKVKFLYAIRDDMFISNERSKFFDFIIPVVPVINNSNSLDKIQERLNVHSFHADVSQQFIREVSLYVDDLRLIQNIFNEFCIYEQQLKSHSYDKTKLLAILIYKNSYPGDFESLHYRRGAFFAICSQKSQIIEKRRVELREEIKSLHNEIDNSDDEALLNVEDLIKLFMFGLICRYPSMKITSIASSSENYDFNTPVDIEKFEKVISEKNVHIIYENASGYQNTRSIGDFTSIEEDIYGGSTYFKRKDDINNKNHIRRNAIQKKIEELDCEINSLGGITLDELIILDRNTMKKLCLENNVIESDLLLYLISSGFLDEDYYYYTSSFHEGRLSKKDRDYLLLIRNEREPDSAYFLDHPEEVMLNMRDTDFESIYALNVKLVDLLVEQEGCGGRLERVIDFISKNIESCDVFFDDYWRSGINLDKFCQCLTSRWNRYAVAAIGLSNSTRHIASIIKHCPVNIIKSQVDESDSLAIYLSDYYSIVFSDAIFPSEHYEVINELGVIVKDISSAFNNQKLFEHCYVNNLYSITRENIKSIFDFFGCDVTNLQSMNYTVIMESSLKELKCYVSENISDYVSGVLLSEKENTKEKSQYILEMLNFESLTAKQKRDVIISQDYTFGEILELPKDIWVDCFIKGKIEYTWSNLLAFYQFNQSEDCLEKIEFIELVKLPMLIDSLEKLEMPIESDLLLEFAREIIGCDTLDDSLYARFNRILPYTWKSYPSRCSIEKIMALCSLGKVAFNRDTLSISAGNEELLRLYVRVHIGDFKKVDNVAFYQDNESIIYEVLKSSLSSVQKMSIIKTLPVAIFSKSNDVVDLTAKIFIDSNSSLNHMTESLIDAVICNVRDINDAISLLVVISKSGSPDRINNLLSKLPAPYSKITTKNYSLTIIFSEKNSALVKGLKQLKLIASYRKNGNFIKIQTNS